MAHSEVLAIIKKDPQLVEFQKVLDQKQKDFDTKMGFILKQAENAKAEAKKEIEEYLGQIEVYLLETKALEKPVNKETHHLCFSDAGTIDLHSNQAHAEHPLQRILGRMFGIEL